MASNAQGEGASGGSTSKRGRKTGGKLKAPKVRQRGMGVAQLEHLRVQKQKAAAGSVVPNNFRDVPVYQLQEGMRVQNPYFLSSVPPFFSHTPVTAPHLAGPQGLKENLSFSMPCYDPASSWTSSRSHCPQSEKMSMGSDGYDLQRSSLQDGKKYDDLVFRPPNSFTNLLQDEDSKAETEQFNKKAQTNLLGEGSANKKARTDSLGEGSAAERPSSSQEPDLELRLFL